MPQPLKAISIIINDLAKKKKTRAIIIRQNLEKYISPCKEKGNVIYFPFYQRKLCAVYEF